MPAARITDQHGGSIRRNLKSESEVTLIAKPALSLLGVSFAES